MNAIRSFLRRKLRALICWALSVPVPTDDGASEVVFVDRPVTNAGVSAFLHALHAAEVGGDEARTAEQWADEFKCAGLMPLVCRAGLRRLGSHDELTDVDAARVPAAMSLRAFRRVYGEALAAVATLGGVSAIVEQKG